jgi:hypothetical protein
MGGLVDNYTLANRWPLGTEADATFPSFQNVVNLTFEKR